MDMVVAMGKKAKSPRELEQQLISFADFPDSELTHQFSMELFSKIPRVAATSSPSSNAVPVSKAQEMEARRLLRQNKSFKILEEVEDELRSASQTPPKKSSSSFSGKTAGDQEQRIQKNLDPESSSMKKERRSRNSRTERHTSDDDDDDSSEPISTIQAKESQKQLDRFEKDAKEVEELNRRLREKEQVKTKKVGAAATLDRLKQQAKEKIEKQLQILNLKEEEKQQKMQNQRVQSRRDYLIRREEKISKIREILLTEVDNVKDKFSAEDVAEIQKERMIEDLAKQRRDLLQEKEYDGFEMIQSYEEDAEGRKRKRDLLKPTYRADKSDISSKTEQALWEETQFEVSRAEYGSKIGGDEKQQMQKKKFDLLFDEIDFISSSALEGKNVDGSFLSSAELKVEERKAQTAFERIQIDRKKLPVYEYRERFLAAMEKYQILVIEGETGSGKTTQLPQYLYEAGYCSPGPDGKPMMIGCTQPRRVAAMSVSKRVADEMGVKLGHEVGYSIRFEDCTSEKTVLKYMTDGMLLREFLSEPDLRHYSVLMIDEAHERTLHTDILFGLVKDITRFRTDLKLIIASATLDAQKFSEYFDGAMVFSIPGRRFPVEIFYTKAPEADYVDATVVTTLQIHVTQPLGDILVFLPGQEEVEMAAEMLAYRTRGLGSRIKELIITKIYANLPTDLQAQIFDPTPPGARKVVIATNIAETSITIDGIKFVVDPGFCKQNSYNPKTGMESLIVVPISKASADQRAGRAGRTQAGACYRLFTHWAFDNELEDNTMPEIQRTNLGNVVLLLKSLGINDLIHFDFMDPPPAETLIKALEHLYALGALNDRGELTKLGRRMAEFPIDPQMAKMIIAAEPFGVVSEIISICSMLSVNSAIFYRPKEKKMQADVARKNFTVPYGDHLVLLNIFNQWADTGFSALWCNENYLQYRSLMRAKDVREQLSGLLERVDISESSNLSDHINIRKAITSGYFYHTAKINKSGNYRSVKTNQTVYIHPASSLMEENPKTVIYHELVFTKKEYMRQIIDIQPEWLVELAPHYYKVKDFEKGPATSKNQGKASTIN